MIPDLKEADNKMKKKLLICHHYQPEEKAGGITSVMRNMHPYLSEAFDVEYMTLPKSWQHGSTRASFFLYMWLHKGRLKKYDFIISHIPESSFWMVKSGMPCAHVYHGDGHPMKGGSPLKKPFVALYDHIFKTINDNCPLVYCVGTKRRLENKKLYNPLIQDVKPLPTENRKGFVFTGRLVNLKRVDRLIKIYAKLPETVRVENPFYIVGDGYCREELETLVESLDMKNQVIFMGAKPNNEMMSIVSSKRILLMASTTEGFPTSIAEAFSVGVPAISTAVGSVATVVENDVNGFFVSKEFDDNEYINHIITILDDYTRFANGALKTAELFNAERVTKGVIDDINNLLGSN